MKRILLFLLSAAAYACTQAPAASDYAIVAGPGIADDPQWSAVVEALSVYNTDAYAKVICDVIEEMKPEAFLIGATNIGRDLGPRCAARRPATWPSWTGPNASGATTSSSSTA